MSGLFMIDIRTGLTQIKQIWDIWTQKNGNFDIFNPLNPPYQGDFKRKCVSPIELIRPVGVARHKAETILAKQDLRE